jgi:hypothetical protein
MAERRTRRREINAGLRQVYEAVVNEPVPEGFRELLESGLLTSEPGAAQGETQP